MLGSRETGKNLSKTYWNVYCELLRLFWKKYWLMCFDFFLHQCMNVNIIISCLILYFNFYLFFFLFCVFFSLLMNFRKVCTCPCGRYVKKNKCWWHALQNVTKKNICAFCIKLFGLCLIVFIATIAMKFNIWQQRFLISHRRHKVLFYLNLI